MCVLSIKVHIRKKSGNLFNDPRTKLIRIGGRYSIPRIAPLYLDTYLIFLSVKQGGIKYHFKSLCITRYRIEPRSPGPLANTLPPWPDQLISSLIL